MGLTSAEQVIMIILAITLAILLILAITAVAVIIKLVRSVQRVTEKAEHIIASAEAVSTVFRKASGPVAVTQIIRNIVHMVHDHQSKKKEDA